MQTRNRFTALNAMVLVLIGAVTMCIATPTAEAAKSPKVKITLENTEADLVLFIDQARAEADTIAAQMQSEIFAARIDGKLKQVLKLEKKFDKRIRKLMGSFDRALVKARVKKSAKLERDKVDPRGRLLVQQQFEDAGADIEAIRDSLETDLATIVAEAVTELTAG